MSKIEDVSNTTAPDQNTIHFARVDDLPIIVCVIEPPGGDDFGVGFSVCLSGQVRAR